MAIALLGGAAFVLSLGTGLRLERGAPPLPIPLPYQALYARVPGFGALRVPSRWGWLVTLALAVLAALGLAWLLARCAPRWRPLVGGAALGLVLLETVSVPAYLTDPALLRDVPPVYRWLGAPEQRDVGVVLELPVHVVLRGQEIDRIAQRQYFGRYHWKQLVVSYSGLVPFGTTELITRLERLPEAETLRYLQILGVDTVVVHRDQYDASALPRLLDAFDASPLVQRRVEIGAAAVYRLLPDPEIAGLVPSAATGDTIYVSNDERVPGMLALALARRWREAGWRLSGDGRPRYYAPLGTAPVGTVATYGLLAAGEDPARHGYAPGGLRWRSHGLAFYAADPALRASLDLGSHAGGTYHPAYPAALDMTVGAAQLRAGQGNGTSATWARQLAGPTAYLEFDVASLTAQTLTIGDTTHQLAPGLTVVRTRVALDQAVSIAGQPGVTAIQRVRVRAAPAEPDATSVGATLAASADATFAGSRLELAVQAGGMGSLLLDVWGAAAYDDRPVHLLSGAQPVAAGGGVLGFDVDLLDPAAPWLKQSAPPVDGRYIAYLKDAARPDAPGVPVAKFVIRRGMLVDAEPVPLPLTTIP